MRNGGQIIDGNASDTIRTMNRRRNGSLDGITGDDAGLDQEEEIETVEPRYRTSDWSNPEEDSSLSSVFEMPKIPSSEATAAKELPKPMTRLKNYAF